MQVLLLDNRDSFVWNLAHAFGSLGCSIRVERSDAIGVDSILRGDGSRPDAIVLSPGPGRPEDAGCSVALIERFEVEPATSIPTLGVCLGHQAIAVATGAIVDRTEPRHGKTSEVRHFGRWPFEGMPDPLRLARYHSLAVERTTLPPELEELASTDEGVVMALRHRRLPLLGFQFHPESFLSDQGLELCSRFLESARSFNSTRSGEEVSD